MKLNASPAGGATIMRTVKPHFKPYAARGVPNGRVEPQTLGQGRTPWRPHSRMIREDPMMTEMMLPNALSAIKKLSALEACLLPKTAVKNREATSCFELAMDFFGTEARLSKCRRIV